MLELLTGQPPIAVAALHMEEPDLYQEMPCTGEGSGARRAGGAGGDRASVSELKKKKNTRTGKFTNECLLTVYDSARAHIRVRVPAAGSVDDLAKALTLAKWADSMLGVVKLLYVNRPQLDRRQVYSSKSVFTTAALADAGDEDLDVHG